MSGSYLLHGLRLTSDVALPDVAASAPWQVADIQIHLGDPHRVQDVPPSGELLAEHLLHGRRQYAGSRVEGGHRFRVPGFADFDLAGRSKTQLITCRPDPSAAAGFLPIMLVGNVLSFALGLEGRAVLHASAVEVADGALAVVGVSGMGKSTLAAWLCAAGAPLVSDDVLRVDSDGLTCHRGGRELRLRARAEPLVAAISGATVARRTVDGRDAVRPTSTLATTLPLRGVVVPRPRPDSTDLVVQRLDRMTAAMLLTRFPRSLGWRVPDPVAAHFDVATAMADQVPVHIVDLPWGPPFDVSAMHELLERLDLDLPVRAAAGPR